MDGPEAMFTSYPRQITDTDLCVTIVHEPFTQLISVHACVKFDGRRKQFPLAFVLMSRRQKDDYVKVLRVLKEAVVEPQVEVVVLDFEKGAKVNDPCHPDYVPTVFKLDRYERASKRCTCTAGAKVNDPCHPDYVPTVSKLDRYERASKRCTAGTLAAMHGRLNSHRARRLKLAATTPRYSTQNLPHADAVSIDDTMSTDDRTGVIRRIAEEHTYSTKGSACLMNQSKGDTMMHTKHGRIDYTKQIHVANEHVRTITRPHAIWFRKHTSGNDAYDSIRADSEAQNNSVVIDEYNDCDNTREDRQSEMEAGPKAIHHDLQGLRVERDGQDMYVRVLQEQDLPNSTDVGGNAEKLSLPDVTGEEGQISLPDVSGEEGQISVSDGSGPGEKMYITDVSSEPEQMSPTDVSGDSEQMSVTDISGINCKNCRKYLKQIEKLKRELGHLINKYDETT